MKRAEFRGRHYDVSIDVQADRLLTVDVQDSLTRDCWSGKYDVTYIEELSHKTGNFKQFSIFCSMLESSLVKGTKSVSLDLLTYDDLNALRQQKSEKAHNNNKRYLIMTYTVEFDQIHYPLPLTYSGRKNISPSRRSPSKRSSESELVTENKALKRELRQCYEKLDNIENEDQDVVKEISMLKKVVQNLENELAKEKTKHQRIMNKKKNEYQELLEEFEELKANERNFRVRCKSLTEELAIIKRNSRLSPCTKKATNRKNSTLLNNTTSNQTRRSVSRDNNKRIGRSGVRTSSGDRSSIGRRTPSPGYARFDPSAYIREREEKRGNSLNNSSSRKITPISSKRRVTPVSSSRRVTPISSSRRVTPVSSSNRRVTPVSKRHSSYSSKPPSSRRSGKTRGYISATSDNDSLPRSSRRERRSNFSDSGSERKPPKSRVTSKSPLHRKKSPLHRKKSRSEDEEEEESGNHSLGIAEIDARLEALQRFMRDNMD